MKFSELEKRVIDISYKNNIGHLSSNINSVEIINEIFETKNQNDVFILSSGHAGLALYCVLEKFDNKDAEKLYKLHGVHPHRDLENGIHCSTGSLGMALTLACGYALADKSRDVYCLISDGECAEGSIWESLRFAYEQKLTNLKVYVNVNGMMAYDFLDDEYLIKRLNSFFPEIRIRKTVPPVLNDATGILTHYYILKEKDYEKIIR